MDDSITDRRVKDFEDKWLIGSRIRPLGMGDCSEKLGQFMYITNICKGKLYFKADKYENNKIVESGEYPKDCACWTVYKGGGSGEQFNMVTE